MGSKLFAIKLDRRIKEAMDFISKRTGKTLTKIYYQKIVDETYRILGEELVKMLGSVESGDRHIPIVIEEFSALMERRDVKEEFHRIFSNVKFVDREWLLIETKIDDVYRTIGKKYLENNGPLGRVDTYLLKGIFFKHLLFLTYSYTAMGIYHEIENEWKKNAAKIDRFVEWLIRKYDEIYAPQEVEIDEIIEAEVIKK